MADVVKEPLNVAGLLTIVYSRTDLRDKDTSEPVVVLFFLHGRGESADAVDNVARAAFAWAAQRQANSKHEPPRDFIVVTFDQRNHGKRTVDERGNLGWSRKEEYHNERHAVDMYGMLVGAVKDVSYLIDVLPAYLFPHDERTIGEWVLAGFSLGGHATWIALRQEPRIRIGIPICGCPDYLALIERRAERQGIPRAPPHIPSSLRALVHAHASTTITTTTTGKQPDGPGDPPASVFNGKSVLVLSGADDRIVPWEVSRAFVEALDVGRSGRKEVVVMSGVKHEFTEEMREEMFRFFWEEALVGGGGAIAVRRSAL